MARLPFNSYAVVQSYVQLGLVEAEFTVDIADYTGNYSAADAAVDDIFVCEVDFGELLKFKVSEIVAVDMFASPNLKFRAVFLDGAEIPPFGFIYNSIMSRNTNGTIMVPDPDVNGFSRAFAHMVQNLNDQYLASAGGSTIVLDEDLTYQIDGVKDTFTVKSGSYLADSLQVMVGAVQQVQGTTFFTDDAATGKFRMSRALDSEDGALIVSYKVR